MPKKRKIGLRRAAVPAREPLGQQPVALFPIDLAIKASYLNQIDRGIGGIGSISTSEYLEHYLYSSNTAISNSVESLLNETKNSIECSSIEFKSI